MGEYIPQLINDKTIEDFRIELAESAELLNEAIKGLSEEDFTKKLPYYDKETGSNLAWILYHVAEDEVHHRGQISWIRKLYKLEKEKANVS